MSFFEIYNDESGEANYTSDLNEALYNAKLQAKKLDRFSSSVTVTQTNKQSGEIIVNSTFYEYRKTFYHIGTVTTESYDYQFINLK